MVWLAYEPRLAGSPQPELDWLMANSRENRLIAKEILPRAIRRLIATERPEDLAECVRVLGEATSATRSTILEAFLLALRDRQADPPSIWKSILPKLLDDPNQAVRRLARRLAVKFHDPEAVHRCIACLLSKEKPIPERIDAASDLGDVHPAEALKPLEDTLVREKDPALRCEICRSLATYDDPAIPPLVLSKWREFPPAVRVEAVNLLAGRKKWAYSLLAAVARKDVARTDLNNQVILRMRALRDSKLNQQIEAVWGRVRDQTPSEMNALIDRMRNALYADHGSIEKGRKVFETQCGKCHRFAGTGHNVGPELDGASRDIEYLLINVLDPNRVVGQPYYVRFVTLKNGRVETGLLAAEDSRSITLKAENDALIVLQKADVEEVVVQEKSLMPEGLNNNMSAQDFRDLVRYIMANPFLTEVAVAGPFPREGVHVANPVDVIRKMDIKWTHPAVGPPGRIMLPLAYGNEDFVAYIAADVVAAEPMRTRLLLGCSSGTEAWLNGEAVYAGRPGPAASPDQAAVEMNLKKGSNRLLLRVKYHGSREVLFARFFDPGRKLTYPELKR
jgi:putative heme-binding domain-containing protein